MRNLRRAVLDASILVQTIVKEKYTDTSLNLVSTLKTIIVPSLTLYEVGNALVTLTRRQYINKDDAIRKFKTVNSIPTLDIKNVKLSKAIDLAIELKINLYDASYLALAIETDAPLITADNELHEKGKKAAKTIHISEISL